MVKKHIKICDICEKTVAEKKCFICKKDICTICKRHLQIKLSAEESSIKEISPIWDVCQDCNSNIQQIEFKNKDFHKQMTDLVKPYLIKSMILNKLEDKKPKPESALVTTSGTFVVSGTSTWAAPAPSIGSAFVGIAQTGANKGKIVSVKVK